MTNGCLNGKCVALKYFRPRKFWPSLGTCWQRTCPRTIAFLLQQPNILSPPRGNRPVSPFTSPSPSFSLSCLLGSGGEPGGCSLNIYRFLLAGSQRPGIPDTVVTPSAEQEPMSSLVIALRVCRLYATVVYSLLPSRSSALPMPVRCLLEGSIMPISLMEDTTLKFHR